MFVSFNMTFGNWHILKLMYNPVQHIHIHRFYFNILSSKLHNKAVNKIHFKHKRSEMELKHVKTLMMLTVAHAQFTLLPSSSIYLKLPAIKPFDVDN